MNPLTERVECAYCDAIPLRSEAALLAERRDWRLWLCPACSDLAEPIWQTEPGGIPPAIKNRLTQDRRP
jgi:hypothetical protein